MESLQKEGVPAGAVQDAAAIASDPQLRSRGFFCEVQDIKRGRKTTDTEPILLSDNPAEYRRAAPAPGQDNEYVYRHLLGIEGEEIERLRKRGVI
jgi:crotonobetainyl-CoA:carnitine CoA-transferase CaiB-like acyl-CoA transferase